MSSSPSSRSTFLLIAAAVAAAIGTVLIFLYVGYMGSVDRDRDWRIEQDGTCQVLVNSNGQPVDMECP